MILPIILIMGGIVMQYVKRNLYIGLRTSTTLSDPEIWERSNKVTGLLIVVSGAILFILTLISYFFNWKIWFNILFSITLIIIVLGIAVFGILYSENLKRKKEKEIQIKPIIITKTFVYIMCIFTITLIIIGLISPFIPPNSYIGIRISKTFSDPAIWKKVNTISGIGLIIIGLIFTLLFFNIVKKEEGERTKLFVKFATIFILLIIGWTIISVLFAYFI